MPSPDVTVILAAGAGTRLGGRGKALLRIGGETLASRALRCAREADTRPLIVLGHRAEPVREQLFQGPGLADAEWVLCPDWEQGLSASFRAGVEAAAQQGAGRVAVVLVDQPGIGAVALRRVLQAHAPGRITQGLIRGTRTHPVVFDLAAAQAAAAIALGDAGARPYLRAHPELIEAVDLSGIAQAQDIDTPQDLDRWSGPGPRTAAPLHGA
ncbi:NTP transferase domain-containing protein [Nesterenkonia sp. E16_7]|uniref:nucleotidyltransferase family protein n=1 Tax=unclassified Nesterenkonia TaxID=2629769 RepID=UPI001A931A2C|nr:MULTISPECIES: NTP transferase domain-containing protein [unclassified Nesterenkonia]MBO0595607.1 NTP transferase domain-containing protein [Nesterenkonia sp. E16_10]MBO0598284.1 NTP transferase domain-containing protein [Nesterenkonia sp. E16_7]